MCLTSRFQTLLPYEKLIETVVELPSDNVLPVFMASASGV